MRLRFQFRLRTLMIAVAFAATLAAVPSHVWTNVSDDSELVFNSGGYAFVVVCWVAAYLTWKYFSTLAK